MNDRKLRAFAGLSLVVGFILMVLSTLFYFLNLPLQVTLLILGAITVLQFRNAPKLYNLIYASPVIDLPVGLRKKNPPLGYAELKKDQGEGFEVILLRPPSQVLSAPDCGEAMGLGYLAGELRKKGIKTLVIDARLMGLDVMQTVELLQMYSAPMLGINLNFQYLAESTTQLIQALRLRKYSSHITLGGLYTSVAYEELFTKVPGIDTIVRFEGERTYLELLDAIDRPQEWSGIPGLVFRGQDGIIVVNPLRSLIADLNEISNPERDYLSYVKEMGGYAYVVSSRGCNGVCAYCVQQRSVSDPKGSRWRGRDPVEVANELKHLRDEFGIRLFSFVDDDFFGAKLNGKTHAERVAEALIERNVDISYLISVQPRDIEYESCALLKKSGMNSVILATDNFSQAVLDRYKKLTTVEQNIQSVRILESLDIDVYLGLIMFDPWTTLDELKENLVILSDLPYLRPWQILSKLEVYHGSPITAELERLDLLYKVGFNYRYNYLDNRIHGVFLAIESVMKVLNPSMMELDSFRWGNLDYSNENRWILENKAPELKKINMDFNKQVMEIALEIVERQALSAEPIQPLILADEKMIRRAEILNEQTIRDIKYLSKQMGELDTVSTMKTIPLEVVRPGEEKE